MIWQNLVLFPEGSSAPPSDMLWHTSQIDGGGALNTCAHLIFVPFFNVMSCFCLLMYYKGRGLGLAGFHIRNAWGPQIEMLSLIQRVQCFLGSEAPSPSSRLCVCNGRCRLLGNLIFLWLSDSVEFPRCVVSSFKLFLLLVNVCLILSQDLPLTFPSLVVKQLVFWDQCLSW